MYNVSRSNHTKYGNVVEIIRDDNGLVESPSMAYNIALMIRNSWKKEGAKKIRFLIDDQILNSSQTESWSITEYKNLPKCFACASILHEDVFTHVLCRENLFCTQRCADKDYQEQMDKINDEEECDFQ